MTEMKAGQVRIFQCESCGEVFDPKSDGARYGEHETICSIDLGDGNREPEQCRCGPVTERILVGESQFAEPLQGHIEVKLDFIPVEERLPEESMRVALFLREEKTSQDRVDSWRPQGTSFERFVLGSYDARDKIWFTPYRAYFAGKAAPIEGWAEIPEDAQS